MKVIDYIRFENDNSPFVSCPACRQPIDKPGVTSDLTYDSSFTFKCEHEGGYYIQISRRNNFLFDINKVLFCYPERKYFFAVDLLNLCVILYAKESAKPVTQTLLMEGDGVLDLEFSTFEKKISSLLNFV